MFLRNEVSSSIFYSRTMLRTGHVRERERERRDQFHSHDPVSLTGTAIFERSFTKKIVQFSYNPGQLLPRRKGEEREEIRRLKTKLFALIVSPYSGKSSSRIR